MFSVFVVEHIYSLSLFCGCILCFYLFLCGFFFGFCVCLSAVPALSGALSGLKIRFCLRAFSCFIFFFLLGARVLHDVRVVCVERLLRWVARILLCCTCVLVCCCCCVVCYGLRGRGHASYIMTIHQVRLGCTREPSPWLAEQ